MEVPNFVCIDCIISKFLFALSMLRLLLSQVNKYTWVVYKWCMSRNVVLDSIHKMFKSSLHMLFHLVSKLSYMVTSSLYKFLMGERNHDFMQEIEKNNLSIMFVVMGRKKPISIKNSKIWTIRLLMSLVTTMCDVSKDFVVSISNVKSIVRSHL
jgi:hypothetical protein